MRVRAHPGRPLGSETAPCEETTSSQNNTVDTTRTLLRLSSCDTHGDIVRVCDAVGMRDVAVARLALPTPGSINLGSGGISLQLPDEPVPPEDILENEPLP